MANRRSLITGGSQGIGAAIVQAARAAGNEVVFTGRNNPNKLCASDIFDAILSTLSANRRAL